MNVRPRVVYCTIRRNDARDRHTLDGMLEGIQAKVLSRHPDWSRRLDIVRRQKMKAYRDKHYWSL